MKWIDGGPRQHCLADAHTCAQCFHARNNYKELGDAIKHVTFQDTHLNKERSYINFLIYNTDAVKLESSIQPSPGINMFVYLQYHLRRLFETVKSPPCGSHPKHVFWNILWWSLVMNDMNVILYTSGAVMVPYYFHHLSAPPLQNSIMISYGRCNSKILHKRMSTPRLHVFLRCPPRAFAPAHSVAVPRRSVVHTAPANEQSGGAFFLGEELHVCRWFVGER